MTATDTQTARQNLGGCEPLLALATPELYRRNLFRVLGIRVDDSVREVSRREQRRRMQEKLGITGEPAGATSAWALEASDEQRQNAQDLMGRPVERVVHELFWFWPDGDAAPGLQAVLEGHTDDAVRFWEEAPAGPMRGVGRHNLAVLYHAQALELERNAAQPSPTLPAERKHAWTKALVAWKRVCDTEDFWDAYRERFSALDDAQLTPSLIRRIRASLPEGLVSVSAAVAFEAASHGDAGRARALLEIPREAGFEAGVVEAALRRVLGPVRERVKASTERTRRRCTADPRAGNRTVLALHKEATEVLATVDALLPLGEPIRTNLHDAVAEAMLQGLVTFGDRTELWEESAESHRLALEIAEGATVRQQVADNLETVEGLGREGFFWCASGYWDLPETLIEAIEAARAKIDARDFESGIANLLEMDPRAHPALPNILRRALAYSLNMQAVTRINSAQRELSGHRLASVVTELLPKVILADELQPGSQTVIDNRSGMEDLARRLGARIPTSAALRRELAGVSVQGAPVEIAPGSASETCHFCSERPGTPDAAILVPMSGSVERTELLLGQGVTFEFGSVAVPRCGPCRDEHADYPERVATWRHERAQASKPENFPELQAELEARRALEREASEALAVARREAESARAQVARSADIGTTCERCGEKLEGALCPECDADVWALGDDWIWVVGVAVGAFVLAMVFDWRFGAFKTGLGFGALAFGELVFSRFRELQNRHTLRMPEIERKRALATARASKQAEVAEQRYAQLQDKYDDGGAAASTEARDRLAEAREAAALAFAAEHPEPEPIDGVLGEELFTDFPEIEQRRQTGWGFGANPGDDLIPRPEPVGVTGLVARPIPPLALQGWTECPNCSRAFEIEDENAGYRFECECGSTFDYGAGVAELVGQPSPASDPAESSGGHRFNDRDICTDCGCSRGAIDHYGYECKKT